jgi:hypothetical protein
VSVIEGDFPREDLGFAWLALLKNAAKRIPMKTIIKNGQSIQVPESDTTSGLGRFRLARPRMRMARIPTRSLTRNVSNIAKTAIDPLNLRKNIPSGLNQISQAVNPLLQTATSVATNPDVIKTAMSIAAPETMLLTNPQLLNTAASLISNKGGGQSVSRSSISNQMSDDDKSNQDFADSESAVSRINSYQDAQDVNQSNVKAGIDLANFASTFLGLGVVSNPKYKTVKQLLADPAGRKLWNNTKEGGIVPGTNLRKVTKKTPIQKTATSQKRTVDKKKTIPKSAISASPVNLPDPTKRDPAFTDYASTEQYVPVKKQSENISHEIKTALWDKNDSVTHADNRQTHNYNLPAWINPKNILILLVLIFIGPIIYKYVGKKL